MAVLNGVNTAVQSIIADHNRIDIIINNASIAHIGNAETTTPEDVERLLSVNVKTTRRATPGGYAVRC